jgi:hypothetical protein
MLCDTESIKARGENGGNTLSDTHSESAIDLVVSDPAELSSLRKWLEAGAPGTGIALRPGVPGVGEQGAIDILSVIAGSSVLVSAIQTLPEFLRSRRSEISITATVKGEPVTLTARNVAEVLPVLERLLDD